MEICVTFIQYVVGKEQIEENSYETLFYNIICDCDFVLVVVSMNDNQVLLCWKIFCVISYEVEMWPMLHPAVKFRQNTRICRE